MYTWLSEPIKLHSNIRTGPFPETLLCPWSELSAMRSKQSTPCCQNQSFLVNLTMSQKYIFGFVIQVMYMSQPRQAMLSKFSYVEALNTEHKEKYILLTEAAHFSKFWHQQCPFSWNSSFWKLKASRCYNLPWYVILLVNYTWIRMSRHWKCLKLARIVQLSKNHSNREGRNCLHYIVLWFKVNIYFSTQFAKIGQLSLV